jgi:hypothetical protein
VTRRVPRFLIATAGIVAGCLLFASCSSNTPSASTTTTAGPGAKTATSIAGVTTIPFNLKYNARTDVTTTGCTQVLGAWKLTGAVKNSFDNTRNFQIVVDYITQPGDTVLDTQIAKVNGLAPGKSANWSTTGASGKKSLACVVRNAQGFPA